jgi:hypothetical protein
MKKILSFTLLMIIVLGSGFGLNAYGMSHSTYIINHNNISMTYEDFEKLQLFGFNHEEILSIEQEEFNKYTKRDILSFYEHKVNIESIYTFENDDLLSQVDTLITDQEMEKRVENYNESIESNFEFSSFSRSKTINEITSFDGGGSGTNNITRTKYESTTYKTYSMYGVYYADQGNNGQFYLKITLDWKITPVKRFVDLITVGFMDNVMLQEEYISGQYYPNIYSEFKYTETIQSSFYGPIVTNYSIVVEGNDYNDYSYNQNEGILGVEYDLPVNVVASGRGYYYSKTYSNFKMKLVSEWTPTVSSITGTTFSGWYTHQVGAGSIDWGNISVSPAPPYFSYSTSFWVDDPSFDDGIGGHIIFQDIN